MNILYEDEHIILCLKPAGVLSESPGMPELLKEQTGAEHIFPVHRLDRAVGGLMVYARTKAAAAELSRQIASRALEKEYLAVVEGNAEEEATLRDLLFKDAAKNKSFVVKRMRKGVREAVLHYRCLARKEGLSLVRIRLETGRSHQIRVQFSFHSLPLVGDAKYGSRNREAALALWSVSLRLRHPITGEIIAMEAPPPDNWPWSIYERPLR